MTCVPTIKYNIFKNDTEINMKLWKYIYQNNYEAFSNSIKEKIINLELIHETYKTSMLYYASRGNKLQFVKCLIENCANINDQNNVSKSTSYMLHATTIIKI
jgi:hypothetical protein